MTTLKQQRKNRLALADMLENRVTDKQFNMDSFTQQCGTVGCALGIAVMSGEFGYGWHPYNAISSTPVKDGKAVSWDFAGSELFGMDAMDYVFWNTCQRPRQKVAAELRAIK
jgi:hypothetical protein